MQRWVTRIGGILGMALTWALGGFCVGAGIELLSELAPDWAFGHRQDIWPNVVAIPGFLAGAVFGIVFSAAERGRAFAELSFARLALWGGLAGLAVAALILALSYDDVRNLSRWVAFLVGMLGSLGIVGGIGTLVLARIARPWRNLLERLGAGGVAAA